MDRFINRGLVLIILAGAVAAPAAAEEANVNALLDRVGIIRGICAVPQCGSGELALSLAQNSEFLVHAFDTDGGKIDVAIGRAVAERLDARRIVFEHLATDTLPYASGFVDLVVVAEPQEVRAAELFRVIRPRGFALIRGKKLPGAELDQIGFELLGTKDGWTLLCKPARKGAADWPHWSHGPDNNPVSEDTAIRAPYLTQWFGQPYYHAMPVVTTVAAGRVFIASGHIAHHDREIPTLNTLLARNGYNGQVLWQRQLPEGYLVHRSAFVAAADAFYMIDGDGVLKLDPETGSELERLKIPETKGTLMWIALVDGVLYGLSGHDDPPATTMKVGADWRGWGWGHVDKNYSPRGKHQIRWGFGSTLAAMDLREKRLLWKHEHSTIDSRGMGMLGKKLFYYVPGKRLACLDGRSGETLWTNEEADQLALIEEEAQGLTGTPGFRTTTMLLATPVGLFLQGQKRSRVVAFSADDGRMLWSKKKYHNNPNMLYADGRLFISGIEGAGEVQVLDPASGEAIESLNFWKGGCTRLTGSPEALYCRGEGLGRYDLAEKVYTAERTARPGCNDGVIAANGLLYVGPWLCDCNLSILGQMVLGPAGRFDAHKQTVNESHLEPASTGPVEEGVAIDERDWPAYRAGNQRTGSSAAIVPATADLLWQRPVAAEDVKLCPPVAVGDALFVAGDDGVVRCLESRKGTERWRYATGGPIAASPTVWQGRVLVGSGDGYVYSLEAATGRLLWRFRVAPVERRIMVYGRLASNWPVNSGVLVDEGTAYAAAGIVFRDGTHVVALDARSGRLKWHNGTTGKPINDRFELQAASVGGCLAIGAGKLWLSSGNVVAPASFDLETGKADVEPAQRVPEWNTVMAQKPEPAGRDIMILDDRYLLHGGRLLYSGQGHVVSAAQVNFRLIDANGGTASPAFTPVRHCAVPPAWDDERFVTPTSRYGHVLAWNVQDVGKRLAEALTQMTEMDKDIPGDNPQKWGQYNLIGRVFSTVERDLRASSLWPTISDEIYALALADNAAILTGRDTGLTGTFFVAAYAKSDGKKLWKIELPSEPVLGGLCIDREGRVLVTLTDGSLSCTGK